jgi:hypothetical protein
MQENKDFNPEEHLQFEPSSEVPVRGAPSEAPEKKSSRIEPTVSPDKSEIESDLQPEKIGRLISERMQDLGYHPVIVFGSANAGKSTLLSSLISYLKTESESGVGIYIGDTIVPVSSDYGRWAIEQANAFFFRGIQEFMLGTANQATKADRPFFIPVRIVPKDKPEIKLAFMESNGEWYKPDIKSARYFQDLKDEINAVLINFQRGISFLHVAPYTQVEAWSSAQIDHEVNKNEIMLADGALVGAMNSYEAVRPFKSDDAHMLIMTKWDARRDEDNSTTLEDALLNVPDSLLITTLLGQYQQGFSAFNSLNISLERKRMMRYCAGIIKGREVVTPNPELQKILDRYRKNLWNWLYANATRTHPDISEEINLFSPPPAINLGLIERMTLALERLITGG